MFSFHILYVHLIFFVQLLHSTSSQLVAIEAIAKLPSVREGMSSVYDGNDSIYIIGGHDGTKFLSDILKYDISTDNVSMVASLPFGVVDGTASIDLQGNIYHHGGNSEHVSLSAIYKYSPVTKTVTVVGQLHTPNQVSTVPVSIELSDIAYILGGWNDTNAVSLFNMTDHSIQRVGSLSRNYYLLTSVSDGKGSAFLFGLENGSNATAFSVEKLNLTSYQSEFGPVTLPRLEYKSMAVWDGNHAYIIGGYGNQSEGYYTNSILQINPITMDNTLLSVDNFPVYGETKFGYSTAIYARSLNRIYFFGGATSLILYDTIWYIQLPQSEVTMTTMQSEVTMTTMQPTTSTSTASLIQLSILTIFYICLGSKFFL